MIGSSAAYPKPAMAPARKKVIVRTLAGSLVWGYLPQAGFVQGDNVSLMAVEGKVNPIPLSDIKHIAYVRDFNLDNQFDPEQLGRKAFPTRPRGDGLWLKLTFLDDETLEGLAPFDLLLADSLIMDRGIFLTPPDARSNTHRLFVPRSAVDSLEVLGYVTAPSRRKVPTLKPETGQAELFASDVRE